MWYIPRCILQLLIISNQSVESAGVLFVKEANIRIEFIIWKKNPKQTIIYDEQDWTNKPKNL